MHARKATGRNFRAERAATRKHGYHQLRCIERSIPVGWPSCSFLSTSLLPLWLRRLCSSSSSAHRRRNTAEQQDGTERGRRSARARERERERKQWAYASEGREEDGNQGWLWPADVVARRQLRIRAVFSFSKVSKLSVTSKSHRNIKYSK